MKAAVCECGDWQWEHVGGEGRCTVCSGSRAPWDGCMEFRGHQFDEMTSFQEEAMRASGRGSLKGALADIYVRTQLPFSDNDRHAIQVIAARHTVNADINAALERRRVAKP